MRNGPNGRRIYHWTPEQDLMLIRMYQEAKGHKQLITGITDLVRRTGFPRHIITTRAQRQGLTGDRRHAWTPADREFLRDNAGDLSINAMRKKLNRTHLSVRNEMTRLGISAKLTEGYSQKDIAGLLGVTEKTVGNWMERKWLRAGENKRITETKLRNFLKAYPEQYRLNRVDEAWFKGMIFPKFGTEVNVYGRPTPMRYREECGEEATL